MKTKPPHVPQPGSSWLTRKKYRVVLNLLFLLALILGGFLAIIFGLAVYEEDSLMYIFLVHGGTALVPVGICSILYDSLLRKSQMEEVRECVGEAILQLDIPKQVEELMPSRYAHIREAGISDASPQGDLAEFEAELKVLPNKEIRILSIYLENDARICKAIKEAVEKRGCTAKLILWNPSEVDALTKRADSLKSHSGTDLVDNIKRSLRSIDSIKKRMRPEDAIKIEVKLYQSFIGVALMGFEGTYHAGFYLRERLVSFGTHLKVIGATRYFYEELDLHFKSQWEDPTNILFDPKLIDQPQAAAHAGRSPEGNLTT